MERLGSIGRIPTVGGFEVTIVKDAIAGVRTKLDDRYQATRIRFGYMASEVLGHGVSGRHRHGHDDPFRNSNG